MATATLLTTPRFLLLSFLVSLLLLLPLPAASDQSQAPSPQTTISAAVDSLVKAAAKPVKPVPASKPAPVAKTPAKPAAVPAKPAAPAVPKPAAVPAKPAAPVPKPARKPAAPAVPKPAAVPAKPAAPVPKPARPAPPGKPAPAAVPAKAAGPAVQPEQAADGSHIGYGAMGSDGVPCDPKNQANCHTPGSSGHNYTRGCNAINHCRCCRRMLLEDQLDPGNFGRQLKGLKDYVKNKLFK